MKKKNNSPKERKGNFELCRVREDARLLDALRAIDAGGAGIALVVDGDTRLVGILTDGDIRRVLLTGAKLDAPLAPHMTRHFTSVAPESGRAEVLDLMQARLIDQIPVVDRAEKLTGLHLLHAVIGAEERANVAVIMAGGLGTRLRPVTEQVPKPMIKVAGRPILERLLLHLVSHGIRRVYLSVHHLGHIIEDYFGDGTRLGCSIDYLREKEPLGTGGALSLLPEIPREPVLVLNGDLITQADISAMFRFHETGGYAATMGVRRYGHQVPYGCVEVAAAYYSAPPGWIGRSVQVQWDSARVRLVEAVTRKLLREHLRRPRGRLQRPLAHCGRPEARRRASGEGRVCLVLPRGPRRAPSGPRGRLQRQVGEGHRCCSHEARAGAGGGCGHLPEPRRPGPPRWCPRLPQGPGDGARG